MISGVSHSGTAALSKRAVIPAPERPAPETHVPSTALVPVTPVERHRAPPSRDHADASFLMHLLATAEHEPQTRRLRQTSSENGAAHYAAAKAGLSSPIPTPPTLQDVA
jgi:hypothetical protein